MSAIIIPFPRPRVLRVDEALLQDTARKLRDRVQWLATHPQEETDRERLSRMIADRIALRKAEAPREQLRTSVAEHCGQIKAEGSSRPAYDRVIAMALEAVHLGLADAERERNDD